MGRTRHVLAALAASFFTLLAFAQASPNETPREDVET